MFQPWSRGAVGLKPSSLTWSTGHPVSHVHVGVASCAGFGYCFITEDLFWGVIWAVGDPQEQERKRAGWRLRPSNLVRLAREIKRSKGNKMIV